MRTPRDCAPSIPWHDSLRTGLAVAKLGSVPIDLLTRGTSSSLQPRKGGKPACTLFTRLSSNPAILCVELSAY